VTNSILHLSHFDVSLRDWTLSLQGHVLDQTSLSVSAWKEIKDWSELRK